MDDDTQRARFRERLTAQDGVFTLAQAHEAGFSDDRIRRRVRAGEWERAGPRVFRVAGREATGRARVLTVMLSLGPRATLVGRSALWWWRMLDAEPENVEAIVPRGCEPEPRAGAVIGRRDVPERRRVVVDGVAVTQRATSLLDAVAEVGVVDGSALVDRALLRGRVSLDALREAQAENTGRAGAAAVRSVIGLAAGGARFEAERTVHALLRRYDVVGWSADVELRLPGFGRVIVDLAFEDVRVAVEIDGRAYHRDLRAFVRDEARQNALTVAGWTVLRTNWHQLVSDPDAFVAALVAVLASRRAAA